MNSGMRHNCVELMHMLPQDLFRWSKNDFNISLHVICSFARDANTKLCHPLIYNIHNATLTILSKQKCELSAARVNKRAIGTPANYNSVCWSTDSVIIMMVPSQNE